RENLAVSSMLVLLAFGCHIILVRRFRQCQTSALWRSSFIARLTKAAPSMIVIRRALIEPQKLLAAPAVTDQRPDLRFSLRADCRPCRAVVQPLALQHRLARLHLAVVSTRLAGR